MKYPEEVLFCAKYLNDRGFLADNTISDLKSSISNFSVDYNLVRVDKNFYTELAEGLRKLWPAGNKTVINRDGSVSEYAWRDSVKNLATRIETLWKLRKLDRFTLDDCLTAARCYLSKYRDNAKFMKILKYFILKQSSVLEHDGRMRYISESPFADLLESTDWRTVQEEYTSDSTITYEQGTLI